MRLPRLTTGSCAAAAKCSERRPPLDWQVAVRFRDAACS